MELHTLMLDISESWKKGFNGHHKIFYKGYFGNLL